MLGIRLSADAEALLERHARSLGRGKSVIAREGIMERLERESVDARMRQAAQTIAESEPMERLAASEQATAAWLAALDAEDGGYDWGPEGPPL